MEEFEEVLSLIAGLNDEELLLLYPYLPLPETDKCSKKQWANEFSLDNFSEEECELNFRFKKADVHRLQTALKIPYRFKGPSKIRVTGTEALCICLRRLAYPNRYLDMMTLFPRSKPQLSHIFNDMIAYICSNVGAKLTSLEQGFLSMWKIKEYAAAIHAKGAPLTRCWGLLNCTVLPICRPGVDQHEYYDDYKHTHAEKFQSLMLPNGIIANLFGPYNGGQYDTAILVASRLLEECKMHMTEADGTAYYMFGDIGYPLRQHLITPFKGDNLSPAEKLFNYHMSTCREAVEWGINKITTLFTFLDYKKNLKIGLQPIGQLYTAGVLLTNCHTCLYGSQTADYFNMTPPSLEEYLS